MKNIKPIEDGTVDGNGAQLYYKIFGTGEPVIVLHGGPGFDHIHMLPFNQLSKKYKVIFYDQRATGNSTGEINENSITLNSFVNDLENIRKKLNLGKIHLIGHSWGSVLAMYYGIKHPDHLKSLILLACYASSEVFGPYFQNIQEKTLPQDSLAMKRIKESDAFQSKQVEVVQKYYQIAIKSMFHDPVFAERMDFRMSENTARNQGAVSGLLMKNIGQFDIHAKLSTIQCPTLIIHGDSDPLPYEAAYKVHQSIPQSRIGVLKNSGHFMFIESPETLFSIIHDFLWDDK